MSRRIRKGGCRCGKVRFEANGQPMLSLACHCTGCQQMTASAFGLTDTYPAVAFKVTQGETVTGGIHRTDAASFLRLLQVLDPHRPGGLDEIVNVRSTLFDEPCKERPFVEIFTAKACPGR